jgi:hypothetical protein
MLVCLLVRLRKLRPRRRLINLRQIRRLELVQKVSKLKRRLQRLQSLVLKERRAKKERLALEEPWELKLLNNKDSGKKPLRNRKEKKKQQ